MKLKNVRCLMFTIFAVLTVSGILFYLIKTELYPFLAVTKPVNGEFLVVEGWIPEYALEDAAAVFRQGHYKYLVTTGLKFTDNQIHAYSSDAECAGKKFADLGLDPILLIPVTAIHTTASKTFSCAIAFQEWLRSTMPNIKSVDVLTVGGHARKTRIMFQKALGENISVGIIAARPRIYDPERWWASKVGIRLIARSVVGYLYAVIFTICRV